MQGGLDGVGEHKTGCLVGLHLDDALGLVDEVAGAVQFRHHISSGGQFRQVDFAVLVGGELRRAPRSVYRLDAEPGVGDHLGRVGAVHLDQPDPGLLVVKKVELLNTVSGLQFNFLRGGIHQMSTVPSVHLLDAVGARPAVREQDFSQGVRLIVPQQFPIPPDTEGDAGHGLMALSVVLDNLQAGQGLVLQGVGDAVPCHHSGGIGLGIPLPPLRGGQFSDFVCPRLQLREGIGTAGAGGTGIGGAALNMLDLNPCPGQAGPGGPVNLLNPQIAVRFVFKGDFGHLAILHSDLFDRLLVHQMILRGHPFVDGIVAHFHQGDGDGTGLRRGVDADGVSVRAHHLEGSAGEGDSSARLILGDLEGGFAGRGRRLVRVIRLVGIRIVRDGVAQQTGLGVRVAEVALEVAVLVRLLAKRVKHDVLVHIGGEGELDAAALARHAVFGVEHLEGTLVAIAGIGDLDLGDVLVVLIHDAGTGGDGGWVLERYIDSLPVHPGRGGDGKHLLAVGGPVNGDGVGRLLVRGGGELGLRHAGPPGALRVDLDGGVEDIFPNLPLRASKAGGHGDGADVPLGDQVAPQGNLAGVKGLIFVIQPQFLQGAVGVHIGNQPHYLGIAGLLLSQITDALPLWNCLGHAVLVGVDTVRWDFLGFPGAVFIEEIGIGLGLYLSIDGQVLHGIAAAVNVDLTQGLLRGGGGARQQDQQGQGHRQGEHQADDSFHLQTSLLSKKREACCLPPVCLGRCWVTSL